MCWLLISNFEIFYLVFAYEEKYMLFEKIFYETD